MSRLESRKKSVIYGDRTLKKSKTNNQVPKEEINPTIKYYPKVSNSFKSIVEALKSINVDSSFKNRKKIAAKNGMAYYYGSFDQNIQLLNLLKKGKLING